MNVSRMTSKTFSGPFASMAHVSNWPASPVSALALASAASLLFLYGHVPLLAVLLVMLIALQALKTPWLAMLALFPLSVSVAAPSVGMGVKEITFASLSAWFWLSMTGQEIARRGWRDLWQQFGLPVGVALALLLLNFCAALSHHGLLMDWLRGVVPYLFLSMIIPLSLALRGDRNRIRWLGISIGLASLLLSAWVLAWFFYHEMWKTYWLLTAGTQVTRVFAAVAGPGQLSGPFIDRITLFVPSATDVLLPLGMSFGFVLAVITARPAQRYAGIALSALSLACILITYTRSMLLSPGVVVITFLLYLALCQRQRLRFAILLLCGLSLFALTLIYALGLQQVWLNRLDLLLGALRDWAGALWAHLTTWMHGAVPDTAAKGAAALPQAPVTLASASSTPDDNVTSRIEEYRIAWQMFTAHPLLGNGLGVKHPMTFVISEGHFLKQNVAYVHNWVFYMLMVAGLPGLLLYATLLCWPVLARLQALRSAQGHRANAEILLRTLLMTLAIYALFFAAARLITFNLLIAAAWAISLANHRLARENPSHPA